MEETAQVKSNRTSNIKNLTDITAYIESKKNRLLSLEAEAQTIREELQEIASLTQTPLKTRYVDVRPTTDNTQLLRGVRQKYVDDFDSLTSNIVFGEQNSATVNH